ncbi:MAG TPA: hypothetical protein VI320_14080 [Terracidiphilus sp.]
MNEGAHRMARPRPLKLDHLWVGFIETRRALASLFRRRFYR